MVEKARREVDGVIRAEFAHEFEFVVRSGAGHGFGPHELCNLYRRRAESACASLDEDCFTGFQFRFVMQIQPRGRENFRNSGGLLKTESAGNGKNHLLRDGNFFRIASAAEQSADFVARPPASAPRCAENDSGDFEPHPFRPSRRRRILSRSLEQVCAVQSRRMNFNKRFILFWCRCGHFAPAERLVFIDEHCVHVHFSFLSVRGCVRRPQQNSVR